MKQLHGCCADSIRLDAALVAALGIALAAFAPRASAALGPGDQAPPFSLPSIVEEEGTFGSECFSQAPVTVLIIWDRGCPHCLSVALQSPALSDSLLPLGGQVLGILLGPDDPQILRDLLWDKGVMTRHLWDYPRQTASAYGLGFKHIGIFVIDRRGTIRAAFDDEVPDLLGPVMPAVREVVKAEATDAAAAQAEPGSAGHDTAEGREGEGAGETAGAGRQGPAPVPASAGSAKPPGTTMPPHGTAAPPHGSTGAIPIGSAPIGWPTIHVDGRMRLVSIENARPGETGLYGEELENGAMLLHRWDLRLSWNLAKGLTFEPWLRVSNEEEAFLTEGAEQLTSRYGTATLRFQRGSFSSVLGAYPLRISPYALQRWDAEDAPPIGGASGCGCSPGGAGISWKSQEILGPEYTFEGASLGLSRREARVRGFFAVPRWERQDSYDLNTGEFREPRFRRTLTGGVIDLGLSGTEDRVYGLATPVGIRFGYVSLEDDRRTLQGSSVYRAPVERDERVSTWLARVQPTKELAIEGELAHARTEFPLPRTDAFPEGGILSMSGSASRLGLRLNVEKGSLAIWGHLHRISIESDFGPIYKALSYEPNNEGWRGAVGANLLQAPHSTRERIGATLFWRGVREIDASNSPTYGRVKQTILSASIKARPHIDLLAEAHWIRMRTIDPDPWPDSGATNSIALDIKWEGWSNLDPMVRIEAIRAHEPLQEAATAWQAYVSLRVLN